MVQRHQLPILVVDDEDRGITRLLAQAGYPTSRASNGEDVQAALRRLPAALLLLDRDLDGCDLGRQFKRTPAAADVLVVLISARDLPPEASADSADEYIARPISDRELLARIDACARILELTRSLRQHVAELQAADDRGRAQFDAAVAARKHTQSKLARTSELLERTGTLAKVGGWEVNLETMKLTWTRETFRIAEIEGSEEPPLEDGINLFAPEARPTIAAAVQAAIDTGTPYDLELPIITAKGRHGWVQTQGWAEVKDGRSVRLFGTFQDITTRKQNEAALAAAVAWQQAVMEHAGRPIVATSPDGTILTFNRAAEQLLGYRADEMIGVATPAVFHDHDQIAERARSLSNELGEPITPGFDVFIARPRRNLPEEQEWIYVRKDGRRIPVSLAITALRDASGTINGYMGIARDLSFEEQARQSQKLESLGRLAGGVAHDFNNMVGVILGHIEFLLDDPGLAPPLRDELITIQDAAQRSATLTRQLLAFARKQPIAPRVLELNTTIPLMLSLLQRLIGEDASVVWQPGPALWPVWMDPSQMDQILTNLCVNARDAIRGVGTITITTENRHLDPQIAHPDAPVGEYVCIAVADTGHGMDSATLAQIFEPFFTTKAIGEGTGLGLAMVNGTVRQNHGYITVTSEVTRGTTFEIFLPRHRGAASTEHVRPIASAASGHATILVVEDEPGLLRLATRILVATGYVVLSAPGPEEAIRAAKAHVGAIDLLLTDVIMPVMNGHELARTLQASMPTLRCVFMSGYTADVIEREGVKEVGAFVQKPFLKEDLLTAVRLTLAGR
ncbi:MAG: response regulator [Proteobacteria bacterium]|nr:response regulator [Pseudomonadota bacterium]